MNSRCNITIKCPACNGWEFEIKTHEKYEGLHNVKKNEYFECDYCSHKFIAEIIYTPVIL